MKNEILINRLFREELDPRLYNLIYEIRDQFRDAGKPIKGRLYVNIQDDFYNGPAIMSAMKAQSMIREPRFYNELTITRGILKRFNIEWDFEELKALIAHEFSHFSNRDPVVRGRRVTICIVSMIGIFVLLAVLQVILNLLIVIIIGLVEWRMIRWLDRKREIRSDTDAAIIIKDPDALQNALKILDKLASDIRKGLRIKDKPRYYFKKSLDPILGSTRPSIDERIKNLEKLKLSPYFLFGTFQ